MSCEYFNTATWNFITGNRYVESIIRESPNGNLILRGGVSSVLPTINALRDLRHIGWKDFPLVPIFAPKNTLTCHSLPLNSDCGNDNIFSNLLEKLYGIKVIEHITSVQDSLIFLINNPENEIFLEESIKEIKNNLLMVVIPPSEVSKSMAPILKRASFSTTFSGHNIFFPSKVEELLWDYNPEQILIIGKDPKRIFYSAIGAVDWYITSNSKQKNPKEMKIWDLFEMGKHIKVILPKIKDKFNNKTIKEYIINHLENDLKVYSTENDYKFTPVPDHKIAIDIING